MSRTDVKIKAYHIPAEAITEVKEWYTHFKKEFECKPDTEQTRIIMNKEINEFQQYLQEKYDNTRILFKLCGSIAYHQCEWDVDRICEAYKKYYPERYHEKEGYTRTEINNMLFELHLADVIGMYENIAFPILYNEYNDERFWGPVTVECRFDW